MKHIFVVMMSHAVIETMLCHFNLIRHLMTGNVSIVACLVTEVCLMVIIVVEEAILGETVHLQGLVPRLGVVELVPGVRWIVLLVHDLLVLVVELGLVEIGWEILIRVVVDCRIVHFFGQERLKRVWSGHFTILRPETVMSVLAHRCRAVMLMVIDDLVE